MAKDLQYDVPLKNAQLDAITAQVGPGALFQLYDGAKPASPAVAVTTQTKVAELVLKNPLAAAAVNGVLTITPPDAAAAIADAEVTNGVTWFRICKADGTPKIDGTVGETAGQFDAVIQNKSVKTGQMTSVTSITITKP